MDFVHDFARALDPDREIVLIFDDWDHIQSELVLASVDYLLNSIPGNLHIIISSKVAPGLSLSRRKARREALSITVDQMKLTSDEVKRFVSINTTLDAQDEQLMERIGRITNGWPIAMQLLLIYLRQGEELDDLEQRLRDSYSDINMFLADEIVSSLPEKASSFLSMTAPLDFFNASLCNWTTGLDDCSESIAELVALGLCEPVKKTGRRWFSYNYLIVNYLRTRLIEQDRQHALDVYAKASAWFEFEGMFGQAIKYAALSENWDRCANLVQERYYDFINASRFDVLSKTLQSIPDRQIMSRPALLIAKTWTLLADNKVIEAERLLKVARAQRTAATEDQDASSSLSTHIKILEATRAAQYGDIQTAKSLAQEASASIPLSDLDLRTWSLNALGTAIARDANSAESIRILNQCEDAAIASMNVTVELISRFYKGQQYINMGNLTAAEELYRKTLSRPDLYSRQTPYIGLSDIGLAKIEYERNQLDKALEHIENGLGRIGNGVEFVATAHLTQSRIAEARGNTDEALAIIEKCISLADSQGYMRMKKLALLRLADCYANAEETDAAYDAVSNLTALGSMDDAEVAESAGIVIAKLLLQKGEASSCVTMAGEYLDRFKGSKRNRSLAGWHAILACALYAHKEKSKAMESLGAAMKLASQAGLVRTIVDCAYGLEAPLRQYCDMGASTTDKSEHGLQSYAQRILELAKTAEPPSDSGAMLTERETVICKYLMRGYSNKEVATALTVSESTVHSHRMNIYSKLNVHNRRELIERLREIGFDR